MEPAANCENLQEIREAIDHIDAQIIQLLGTRFEYVKAAAKFKTDEASVRSVERVQAMLKQRRIWAEAAELDPAMIENLYRSLINYFTQAELQHYNQTVNHRGFET
jgi:isochorismate pyruvate lyase